MTHSCVRRDSFIHGRIESQVQYDAWALVLVRECITSLIHIYDTMHGRLACVNVSVYHVAHPYVRRDSVIKKARMSHKWDMRRE